MNSLLLYIEINGMFVLLLAILLLNMGKTASRSLDERYFVNAIWLNIGVLVADTGTWVMDGRVFFDTLWINKIVFFLYYVLTAVFVFAWAVYSAYKLKVNWNIVKKNLVFIAIPMMIAVGIAVISLWNQCLYKFEDDGTYIRGDMFAIHTAILWIYLILSFVSVVNIILGNRREELLRECMAMMIAVVFPVVGGILQTMFYGLNLAWTGSCLSFVLMFISIQNKQITLDALTNVHNRGSFEKQLRELMENNSIGKELYLVMIDVNKFKIINDKYGHVAGDKALIELGKCLKKIASINKKDFLARYGGDEFVILCYRSDESEIGELLELIDMRCNSLSENANLEFDMSVSLGWARYDSTVHTTAEKFINAADGMMYENKRKF